MNPNEKRSNPSEAHRSQYKRNSLPKTPEDARQKRLALEQQLRKKHREQLITTKRFRTFDAATISGDDGGRLSQYLFFFFFFALNWVSL